jgi:hypothetical protein
MAGKIKLKTSGRETAVGFSKQSQKSENREFGCARAGVRLRKDFESQRAGLFTHQEQRGEKKKHPHHLSEGGRTCSLETLKRTSMGS